MKKIFFSLIIIVSSFSTSGWSYTANVGSIYWSNNGSYVYDVAGNQWTGEDFDGTTGTALTIPPYVRFQNESSIYLDGSGRLSMVHTDPHTAVTLPNYDSSGLWLSISDAAFVVNFQDEQPEPGYSFSMIISPSVYDDFVNLGIATVGSISMLIFQDEEHPVIDSEGNFTPLESMILSEYASLGIMIRVDEVGICTPYYWLNPPDGVLSIEDSNWVQFGTATTTIDTSKLFTPFFSTGTTVFQGDINGDDYVNLVDAIIALKVLAGADTSGLIRPGYAISGADVNSDNRIGLEEAIYALQVVSGVRQDGTDYSGTYYATIGGGSGYQMVINQSGHNVTFTIEGGLELGGTGVVNGNTMNLIIEMPDMDQITIVIKFSNSGQSFDGTLESTEFQGTITGSKNEWETYDLDTNGIPQFVEENYIELVKISKITKFRSGEGHDYSDDFESCRSMKHYFQPKSNIDWSTTKIFSPVKGTVIGTMQEWVGTQIGIQSEDYPAINFILYHVNLTSPLNVGDVITAGQELGTHIGSQTTDVVSDIAVSVNTPNGYRLISYFDVVTDLLFNDYSARGINSREDFKISKLARDADPLTCDGEEFNNSGTLENWVNLN